MVLQVQWALLAQQVLQAREDPQGYQGFLDKTEKPALKASLELQDLREIEGKWELRVCRARRVYLGHLGQKVNQGRL